MAKVDKEAANALIPDVSRVQVRGPLKNRGSVSSGDKRGMAGRPPGSVNKITREMREAVLAAADELGHIPLKDWRKEVNKKISPEDDGIKQFYKMLAVKELRTFGVILARMMPTNVTHTTVAKLPTFMTEEEVIEGFREAGLPLELLDSMSMHDALTLTPEEYGTNPYDDPEADPIDVVPEKDVNWKNVSDCLPPEYREVRVKHDAGINLAMRYGSIWRASSEIDGSSEDQLHGVTCWCDVDQG